MSDYAERFRKIMEKMERRKRNTTKAKEDLSEIMKFLSEQIPDCVTGYKTEKSFFLKGSFWRNPNWVYYEDNVNFALVDGEVKITNFHELRLGESDVEDIKYVKFSDLVESLIEFLDKLTEVETWEKESSDIEKIKNSLLSLPQD